MSGCQGQPNALKAWLEQPGGCTRESTDVCHYSTIVVLALPPTSDRRLATCSGLCSCCKVAKSLQSGSVGGRTRQLAAFERLHCGSSVMSFVLLRFLLNLISTLQGLLFQTPTGYELTKVRSAFRLGKLKKGPGQASCCFGGAAFCGCQTYSLPGL